MANIIKFYKKYWFLILLAFVATSLLLIKIFLVKPSTEVIPSPTQQVQTFKGIVPGKTTTQELSQILGAPDPKQSDFSKNLLSYPREGGGPNHQAVTDGNQTVLLFKEKALTGNLNEYKQSLGNPEGEYYGDNAEIGYKVYVWATKGVAVEASVNNGLIFEIWYFKPTTLDDFMTTWGKTLTKELTPKY